MKIFLIILLLSVPPSALLIYSAVQYYGGASDSDGEQAPSYQEISWKELRKMDLDTGYAPPRLKALNGKRVKIPGYVVPLEDEDTNLKEFLLVPSPQACIHVPPPPANQMLLVKMEAANSPKREWGAVWMQGRLQFAKSQTQYGKIVFKLYGEGSEKYSQQN